MVKRHIVRNRGQVIEGHHQRCSAELCRYWQSEPHGCAGLISILVLLFLVPFPLLQFLTGIKDIPATFGWIQLIGFGGQ